MPSIHKCVPLIPNLLRVFVIFDYYYFFQMILASLLKRSHISPISYVSVFYYHLCAFINQFIY